MLFFCAVEMVSHSTAHGQKQQQKKGSVGRTDDIQKKVSRQV